MLQEEYLGDGLYVSHDGFHFILRAPRETGDHFVYLDERILRYFIKYIESKTKTKIKIERDQTRSQST